MNGPRKRVCRVENMLIDPGETNFRCTVTNFMKKALFFCRATLTQLLHRGSNVLKWEENKKYETLNAETAVSYSTTSPYAEKSQDID